MSDLISRSALIKALEEDKKSICSHVYAMVNPCDADDLEFELEYLIYCQQTVEAKPVVHGEWIHDINNSYGCSECGERETMSPKKLKNYCPNCGADMRKKVE